MHRPPELLPALDDFSARIAAAERAVQESDQRINAVGSQLKAQWKSRLPGIAVAAVGLLVVRQLLQPRGLRSDLRALRSVSPLLTLGNLRALAALVPVVAGIFAKKAKPPLPTVPHLDLVRYSGLWYEIARLPTKHEDACASDITAHYQVFSDGVLVTNRCRRRDGTLKKAIGRARVVDADTNAKLKVTYLPSLLDAIPGVWGDYWVLDTADDYSVAMVGTPARDALWLLAREPTVTDAVLEAFLAKAVALGFETADLIYSEHTVGSAERAAEQSNVATPTPETV
jgi:apolipoprotein D and lipocalin family protein